MGSQLQALHGEHPGQDAGHSKGTYTPEHSGPAQSVKRANIIGQSVKRVNIIGYLVIIGYWLLCTYYLYSTFLVFLLALFRELLACGDAHNEKTAIKI